MFRSREERLKIRELIQANAGMPLNDLKALLDRQGFSKPVGGSTIRYVLKSPDGGSSRKRTKSQGPSKQPVGTSRSTTFDELLEKIEEVGALARSIRDRQREALQSAFLA